MFKPQKSWIPRIELQESHENDNIGDKAALRILTNNPDSQPSIHFNSILSHKISTSVAHRTR